MCKQCETKPVYEFTNQRKLCARCFVRWFEKKFLYTIRKFRMIKKKDTLSGHKNLSRGVIGYHDAKDFRSVVLKNLLEMFSEKSDVEIVKGKGDKIAIISTLDSEANKIINTLIKGKEKDLKKVKPIEGKIIKPLYLFLDEEVLLYAKIKKLEFKQLHRFLKDDLKKKEASVSPKEGREPLRGPKARNEGGKNKIGLFIDGLEKKHPEVKRAVVNSMIEI